jgi:hypothetical protein
MWSEFSLSNYNKLKPIIKKYIDLDSLYFKQTYKNLLKIKSINLIQYDIKNIKIKKDLILKLISSKWVYQNVINKIDNLDVEYLISWNNNKIYLKCTNNKYIKIIKRLPHLLRMIEFIKNGNKENIVIYLLLSNLKKKIDNNIKIKPKNINSGYTDIVNRYIFIWREEEFEKVLFHELVHFYDIDHRDEVYDNYIEYESLFEAITDLKGITYNLIYLSLITNKKLDKLINYEFSFIHNQSIMINNLINNNVKLLSPAFSYYVLKSMLINYITSKKFSFEEYNNLFILNKNFNIIITKLNKIKEVNYINFDSCRMTFFELE